jgi:hypothetical protein
MKYSALASEKCAAIKKGSLGTEVLWNFYMKGIREMMGNDGENDGNDFRFDADK